MHYTEAVIDIMEKFGLDQIDAERRLDCAIEREARKGRENR